MRRGLGLQFPTNGSPVETILPNAYFLADGAVLVAGAALVTG